MDNQVIKDAVENAISTYQKSNDKLPQWLAITITLITFIATFVSTLTPLLVKYLKQRKRSEEKVDFIINILETYIKNNGVKEEVKKTISDMISKEKEKWNKT